jgi:hypothetical protein
MEFGPQAREIIQAFGELAVIVALLCFGKIDQNLATLLIGLVLSGNTAARAWLRAHHVSQVASLIAARGVASPIARTALGEITSLDTAAQTSPLSTEHSAALPTPPPGSGSGVGPKLLPLLCLSCLSWTLLTGCETNIYSLQTGKKKASLAGDYVSVHYKDAECEFGADSAVHSTATRAAGEIITHSIDSAAAAAVPWSPIGKAGAAAPVISAFLHRSTNRTPSTPVPKTGSAALPRTKEAITARKGRAPGESASPPWLCTLYSPDDCPIPPLISFYP